MGCLSGSYQQKQHNYILFSEPTIISLRNPGRDKSDGEDDVMVCENDLGRWDGVVLNQNSKSSRSRRNSYLNRGAKGDSNPREQHGLLEAYG